MNLNRADREDFFIPDPSKQNGHRICIHWPFIVLYVLPVRLFTAGAYFFLLLYIQAIQLRCNTAEFH